MKTATEHAFETCVEEILPRQDGWRRGASAEWDAERALFPDRAGKAVDMDSRNEPGGRRTGVALDKPMKSIPADGGRDRP